MLSSLEEGRKTQQKSLIITIGMYNASLQVPEVQEVKYKYAMFRVGYIQSNGVRAHFSAYEER